MFLDCMHVICYNCDIDNLADPFSYKPYLTYGEYQSARKCPVCRGSYSKTPGFHYKNVLQTSIYH